MHTDSPPTTHGNDQLPVFSLRRIKQQLEEVRSESSNHGIFAVKMCEKFCSSGD